MKIVYVYYVFLLLFGYWTDHFHVLVINGLNVFYNYLKLVSFELEIS